MRGRRPTYDWLVVGAGFTGAVIAERIARKLDKRVLVIDQRPVPGGNAADQFDPHGVLIHPHGPHIFHTNAARIAAYLSHFTQWRPYEHRALALVDGRFVPVPVNLTSLEMIFGAREGERLGRRLVETFGAGVKVPVLDMRASPDREVRRIADLVYEKVFLHYTRKQWGCPPEQLDASVTARVPVHLSRDDRYFQDSFQNMPADGYGALFRNLLDHPNIELRLGAGFAETAASERFGRVVYTGAIDAYFDYVHGPLEYRSLRFEMETHVGGDLVQPTGTLNFPTPPEIDAHTRITEFRHLTGQSDVAATTRAIEYPEPHVPGRNEPYYPVPSSETRARYALYAEEAAKNQSVVFAGRLADYSYYNMDQAVGRALAVFEKQVAPGAL